MRFSFCDTSIFYLLEIQGFTCQKLRGANKGALRRKSHGSETFDQIDGRVGRIRHDFKAFDTVNHVGFMCKLNFSVCLLAYLTGVFPFGNERYQYCKVNDGFLLKKNEDNLSVV